MSKDAPEHKKVVQDVPPSKQKDVQLKGNIKPDGTGYKPRDYVKSNNGAQVGPGETWHDLTLDQRIQHMRRHENKWRERFTAEAGDAKGNMNWTRG